MKREHRSVFTLVFSIVRDMTCANSYRFFTLSVMVILVLSRAGTVRISPGKSFGRHVR